MWVREGQVCVTITTNWNGLTISNNYSMLVAQIKIRPEGTFCKRHMRSSPGVHVPICDGRSEAKGVHCGLDIRRSVLIYGRISLLWSWAKNTDLSFLGDGPRPRRCWVRTRRNNPRQERTRPLLLLGNIQALNL